MNRARANEPLLNVGNAYSFDNVSIRLDRLRCVPRSTRKVLCMRNTLKIMTSLLMLTAGSTAVAAKAPVARISMAKARSMAVRLAPGRIISSEYEKEGGIWRYSFDIQQRGHVQEIGIDGQTGKVVENKSEGTVDHD